MNADRICQYIESKLPRSTWEFHGPDIRRFIESEAMSTELLEASQSPCKETCERSLKDYRDGRFTDIRRFIEKEMMESAVVPVDFTQLSKVNPESMREVIGVDTTGVISDVREFECTLPAEEVASMYRWRSGDDHPSDDRIVMARFNGEEVKAFCFHPAERWCVMRAGEWVRIESPVTEWRELTEGKYTWSEIKRAKKDSTPCVD